jgi:hypothetical protein
VKELQKRKSDVKPNEPFGPKYPVKSNGSSFVLWRDKRDDWLGYENP